MFNKIIQECIKNIYNTDMESQEAFMETVCTKVRRMDYKICLKAKAFFVPNNDYIMQHTISDVLNDKFGIYNFEGICLWQSCLVFPIFDVGNSVVGLAGFNPVNYLKAKETKDWSLNYYSYSKKEVMQRGRYIYTLPNMYEQAIQDGYLIIVDGMFDAIHLAGEGYNAASLMGSSITPEIITQLRFIKKIIIISDNDEAGLKFVKTLRKHLKNTVCLFQGETKDIDELLKTERKEETLKLLNSIINSPFFVDRYINITVK